MIASSREINAGSAAIVFLSSRIGSGARPILFIEARIFTFSFWERLEISYDRRDPGTLQDAITHSV
jgi:hypothetical protein